VRKTKFQTLRFSTAVFLQRPFYLALSKPIVKNESLMHQLLYCMSNSFRHHGAHVKEFGSK